MGCTLLPTIYIQFLPSSSFIIIIKQFYVDVNIDIIFTFFSKHSLIVYRDITSKFANHRWPPQFFLGVRASKQKIDCYLRSLAINT